MITSEGTEILLSTLFPSTSPLKYAIGFAIIIMIAHCLKLCRKTKNVAGKIAPFIKSIPYMMLAGMIIAYYYKCDKDFSSITLLNAFTLIFCIIEAVDNFLQGGINGVNE